MEFIRTAKKLGNSAGVVLPKKILGCEVKVIVVSQPISIKKEALKLLESCFEDIIGIYILRGNEILAVSSETKKTIQNGKIKANIVPISIIKKDLRANDALKKKFLDAFPLLNKSLLFQLKKEIKFKQL